MPHPLQKKQKWGIVADSPTLTRSYGDTVDYSGKWDCSMMARAYGDGWFSVFEGIEVGTRGFEANPLNMRDMILATPDDDKP